MSGLLRFFRRPAPYEPEDDDLVRGLRAATEREDQKRREIRKRRQDGNFLVDRLTLPRPAVDHEEKREGTD